MYLSQGQARLGGALPVARVDDEHHGVDPGGRGRRGVVLAPGVTQVPRATHVVRHHVGVEQPAGLDFVALRRQGGRDVVDADRPRRAAVVGPDVVDGRVLQLHPGDPSQQRGLSARVEAKKNDLGLSFRPPPPEQRVQAVGEGCHFLKTV
jgi:hypothetical protein